MRDILRGIEAVTGRPVPHTVQPRRDGDPASLIADVSLAERLLGFKTVHSDLHTILRTAWRPYDLDRRTPSTPSSP